MSVHSMSERENRPGVCGAPNVHAGIKVVVALPVLALPTIIDQGKIRGLECTGHDLLWVS